MSRHGLRKREAVAEAVDEELWAAINKFGAMAGPHEGWAVIKEELDELWEEVRGDQDPQRMREEAEQIAAMAERFILDVCAPVSTSNQQGGDDE